MNSNSFSALHLAFILKRMIFFSPYGIHRTASIKTYKEKLPWNNNESLYQCEQSHVSISEQTSGEQAWRRQLHVTHVIKSFKIGLGDLQGPFYFRAC